MLVTEFYPIEDEDALPQQRFSPTGFPSPAEEYKHAAINLNKHLKVRAASCLLVRVAGDTRMGPNLRAEDLLVIDRALPVKDQCLVLVAINAEYRIKRYRVMAGRHFLETEEGLPIELLPDADFAIYGVVTWMMRRY